MTPRARKQPSRATARPRLVVPALAGALLTGAVLTTAFSSSITPARADDAAARADRHEELAAAAIGRELKDQGWTLFSKPDWPPAKFNLVAKETIEVTTDDSTSLIWREIPEPDRHKPNLSWSWRVTENMAPTDISVKGGDDRPLALHVWFEDDPDQVGFFEGIKFDILEAIFGIPISGKVLTYVWGGTNERGHRQENPHVGDGSEMIVLRPGTTPEGQWFEEKVNVIADFERAFGYLPVSHKIIALAADSEDTDASSVAHIKELRFSR